MRQFALFLLSLAVLLSTSCKDELTEPCAAENTESLKVNQIQVIASHNSYRIRTYDPLFTSLLNLSQLVTGFFDANELDYTHETLAQQLGQYGMRGLELDIYYDPNGGLFYNRVGNVLINEPIESGISELQQPGFKVLHIPDIDYMTHHYTFKNALQAINEWSDANPQHLPIFIQVETKTEGLADYFVYPGEAIPLEFTPEAADDLDEEIKSVFGNDLQKVITPDEVRGNYATLNEAVIKGNWQTLQQARGKLFFIIDGNYDFYIEGHPSFQGRAMFGYAPPRSPECAFIIANNAIGQKDSITQWVTEGYIVRSRADAGTIEARTNDYAPLNAATESGAQIISTDYYRPDPRHDTSASWTDFTVKFPDGTTARFNPINAATIFDNQCTLNR